MNNAISSSMNEPVRRKLFLQELGLLPQWQRKVLAQEITEETAAHLPVSTASAESMPPMPQVAAEPPPHATPSAPVEPSAPAAPSAPSAPSAPAAPQVVAQSVPVERMNWQQLQTAVASCTACGLCQQRQQTVFGSGVPDASWLLVGDGPDAGDETAGQPFTGQTGLLLDNMLQAVGAGRSDNVYLTNLVKCRAQDASGTARPPAPEEIAACRPFLQRQIALLQPQIVLSLGKLAAQALRQPGAGPLRGVVHQLAADLAPASAALPLIASWHPAIVLQQPLEKRQVWADLCLAQQTLAPGQATKVADDDIPF